MQIFTTVSGLQNHLTQLRAQGLSLGFVPTMGALHSGHLALIDHASRENDISIISIFVNPTQFNNKTDLEKYPRQIDTDITKLEVTDCDIIFLPSEDEMYPEKTESVKIDLNGLDNVMEGAHRPGHFDGVATVVAKLFLQTKADQAFFGEKDFQQLMIVTRMARDLDIDIDVVGCPTIREETGLAMSSRNLLLSDRAALKAATLHEVMTDTVGALAMGADFATLQARAMARLQTADFTEVEYFEMRARDDFTLLDTATRPARLFAAAWMAGVRLIDNIEVPVQG